MSLYLFMLLLNKNYYIELYMRLSYRKQEVIIYEEFRGSYEFK